MSLNLVALAAVLVVVASQSVDWREAFDEFVESQEKLVLDLAEFAANQHADRKMRIRSCECSKHACSNDFLDSPCDESLRAPDFCKTKGQRVDTDGSIVRTPPGTFPSIVSVEMKENICVYQNMRSFITEYGYIDDQGWSYVGLRDGTMHRYPEIARMRGIEGGDENLNNCQEYDPRTRPWYIGGITGPKDIVLVVDKSNSMGEGFRIGGQTKWSVTQRAVLDILDTFTFNDFVNVVTFSDNSSALWNATGFVRGQSDNMRELKRLVSEEQPGGETNFRAAFRTAFHLLSDACSGEAACSNCQKIILFLTDGRDRSRGNESVKPSRMARFIERWQQHLEQTSGGNRASIFTYSMTSDADDAIPRQIACANDGVWSFIGPDTNTLDVLNSYYLYIGARRRTENPVWIELYEDASGLGEVTTVAIPFYAKGTNHTVFLGVVGHTVLLHEIEPLAPSLSSALDALIEHQKCVGWQPTPCTLQIYRNAHDERSQCADPFPIGERSSSESGDRPQCYKLGQRFYKRFSEEVIWDEAVSSCEEDGGELVSIRSKDELAFVANMASDDGSWIGARRLYPDAPFSWLVEGEDDLHKDSDYWGVSESASGSGDAHCAAIDTRGIISNVAARPCNLELSYICKYFNNDTCTDGTAAIPIEGYFAMPPLHACPNQEVLEVVQPLEDSQNLDIDQVICPLGEDRRANEEVICCPVEEETSEDNVSVYIYILVPIGAVLIVFLCVVFVFCFRVRRWEEDKV